LVYALNSTSRDQLQSRYSYKKQQNNYYYDVVYIIPICIYRSYTYSRGGNVVLKKKFPAVKEIEASLPRKKNNVPADPVLSQRSAVHPHTVFIAHPV
jgi:hypothetical protein